MMPTLSSRPGHHLPPAGQAGWTAFALAAGALIALGASPQAVPSARAQTGANDLLMPDLRSAGPTTASLPTGRSAPVRRRFAPSHARGLESISDFGYSAIDLANLSPSALTVKLELSLRGRNPHTLTRQLAAGGTATVRLAQESVISEGFWHGAVRTSGATGVVVRSGWVLSGTSTAAYEGLRPATKLLVPLFVRGVDGVYSDYTIMNTDMTLEENVVTFQAFAPDSGELLAEWEDRLGPGEVTNLDANEIGTPISDLEANRPDDHWVGGLRIEAPGAVAILIYANEALEGGVSAFGARPFAAAATAQYLPLVRRNYLGNSVIAVQNRDRKMATVTIAYRGAPDSPKHANQTVQHTFTIGLNGMHYVDLGTGAIDDVPAPAIDRGGGVNTGFYGSAVVTSDQPVVATVMETTGQPNVTRTSAAYNAFNAADLGTSFIVPAVRHRPGDRVTKLVLYNPGPGGAYANVGIEPAGGQPQRWNQQFIPPGNALTVGTRGAAAFTAPARIGSSAPLAVLVYETPFDTAADYKDADVFDTLAYAAPVGGNVATPVPAPDATPPVTPSASPPTPTRTPTSGPTAGTATGVAPTGSPTAIQTGSPTAIQTTIPTATGTRGTSITPRWKIDLPFVLRGFRIPGR